MKSTLIPICIPNILSPWSRPQCLCLLSLLILLWHGWFYRILGLNLSLFYVVALMMPESHRKRFEASTLTSKWNMMSSFHSSLFSLMNSVLCDSTKSYWGSSVWEMTSFRNVSPSRVMMKVSEEHVSQKCTVHCHIKAICGFLLHDICYSMVLAVSGPNQTNTCWSGQCFCTFKAAAEMNVMEWIY